VLPAPEVPAVLPVVPVVPAVLPEVVDPVVPEAVLPDPMEPLALYGIRQPVTVMVLPDCELGVVCDDDGVDVL